MQQGECIFCAIAAGEQPATIIEQDEHTLVFMDINPWARGHALAIPRKHAENVLQIDHQDLTRTYAIAQRVAGRMKERLGCERVDLWNACGAAASQVVPHFHVHVVPHYAGDPDPLERIPRSKPEPPEVEAVGASLRD